MHSNQVMHCGCGCQKPVPAPCTKDRCRTTVPNTSIAELLWVQGLDENLCERFQRLADVLLLTDCAGNKISIDTPIVACEDFRDQLCLYLAGLESDGEAIPGVTQLVGANCKLYTVPSGGGPGDEVPNSVIDTSTINFSATGTLNRNISGDVRVSPDIGNTLEVHGNGLYVPDSGTPLTVCQQIQAFANGSDAVEGTVLVGADCQKHVLRYPDPLTVTDTASVDLVLTGTNLQANVRLDPDGIGTITAEGILITCQDVEDCITPLTVDDTNSVNLSLSPGNQLSATVILDPVNNDIQQTANGLLLNVCDTIADFIDAGTAVPGVTRLIGKDCLAYTLPDGLDLEVVDTPTVDLLLLNGNELSANVLVQPNTLLTQGPQGLQVTCESVQDCAFGTLNNFWTYNDLGNSVQFNPSGDAGNLITNGLDGRPYVGAPVSVADTSCIDLAMDINGQITAQPVIDPDAGNILECRAGGLFVPAGVDVNVTGDNLNCINVQVTEPTPNNFVVSAQPNILVDPQNSLQCLDDGLFVLNTCGQIQAFPDILELDINEDLRFVVEVTDPITEEISCVVGTLPPVPVAERVEEVTAGPIVVPDTGARVYGTSATIIFANPSLTRPMQVNLSQYAVIEASWTNPYNFQYGIEQEIDAGPTVDQLIRRSAAWAGSEDLVVQRTEFGVVTVPAGGSTSIVVRPFVSSTETGLTVDQFTVVLNLDGKILI